MRRIAAPMVGGMMTALVLSMFVVPAACVIVRGGSMRRRDANALRDPVADAQAPG
jgi:Cu(I)/Ag(I) efflux system membrane protein CusA/SilA